MQLDNCESVGDSGFGIPFNTRENMDGLKPGAVMHFQESICHKLYISQQTRPIEQDLCTTAWYGHSSSFCSLFTPPPPLSSLHLPLQSRMILVDGDFAKARMQCVAVGVRVEGVLTGPPDIGLK